MLSHTTLRSLARTHGTPLYVYDMRDIVSRIRTCARYPVTLRYAVKANMHPDIIRCMYAHGVHFDASSSYEAQALLSYGVAGNRIRLSSQQPAHALRALVQKGVRYTATSLHQLALFSREYTKGGTVGVRINPGFGSGADARRNTGGTQSSFGIWHSYIPEVTAYAHAHALTIDTLHIHVGSGADPRVWEAVMDRALEILLHFPTVTTLDIGGGYKIHRFADEQETNMDEILPLFLKKMSAFTAVHGRTVALEIEPGTWMVGHAGTLLAEVVDVVDTGTHGYHFAKLNTGMNDILRPTMYGAGHAIDVLRTPKNGEEKQPFVFVGHNCETGDVLTPAYGNPNGIEARYVHVPRIGDVVAIRDAGAYCASMRACGYNAFPSAHELCVPSLPQKKQSKKTPRRAQRRTSSSR